MRQLLVKFDIKNRVFQVSQSPSKLLRVSREVTNRSRSFFFWSSEPFERFLQVPSVLRIRLGMYRRDGGSVTAAIDGRDDGSRHARAITAIRASTREIGFRAVHGRRQIC